MNFEHKERSPFYPGQPVPVDLFVGRQNEIARISRAASQVALGKPQAVFISGEYGIGKSSLAQYFQVLAEQDFKILGFHIMLGEIKSIDEIAIPTIEIIAESPSSKESVSLSIRKALSDYIQEVNLFGVKLNLEKLRHDAPEIRHSYLSFLRGVLKQSEKEDYKGIMVILDEINGLSKQYAFAHFLKNIVDRNAISRDPLPLLLVLCGTDERYREIVSNHQPVERIFDIVKVDALSDGESREFFVKAFGEVGMEIEEEALKDLILYSGGLPRLMHIIGDEAFWSTKSQVIDTSDASTAIINAAGVVGRKFIDQQVIKALQSKDYQSIIRKVGESTIGESFRKEEIEGLLTTDEKKKLNNFLQRMKRLKVLISGDIKGEYIFRDRLTWLYIKMYSLGVHQIRL
jgi:hypothetical protein